jgi:predicted amidohydrolase
MIKAGFAQFAPEFGHVGRNLEQMAELAAAADADLLVYPELAATGYEFTDATEVAKHAEKFADGPTAEFLISHARKHRMTLIAGYPEREGDRLYNSCMLATPDGQAWNYRKLHLFSRENELFSPGDAPPPVAETPAGRVGLMICFDWFFPEVARMLALNGAQIIAHPSNLVLGYCQKAMYARSVENGVFTITANRTGIESRAGRTLKFTGGSQVLDTKGQTLACAADDETTVQTAAIDPEVADNKSLNPHNDLLGSRRPEFYGDLTKVRQDS